VGAAESGEDVEDGRADGASGERVVAGAKPAHAATVAATVAGARVEAAAEEDGVNYKKINELI